MNNKFEILVLKQASLSEEDLISIIKLKMQYWPNPYELQRDWINENLRPDDYNLLLKVQGQLVGFMNLVLVNAQLANKCIIQLLGVGNVCVSKEYSGKGIGLLLMQIANYQINSTGYNGVLLCSDKLVNFYFKAGWIKLRGEVYINKTKFKGNTMTLKEIESPSLVLNRNF
jgi:predicted N-acetyltransferase YhbS